MTKNDIDESLEAVHTHTHTHTSDFIKYTRNLLETKIDFINCARKYIKKDRLCRKIRNKLLQNSLSFLCVLEVM